MRRLISFACDDATLVGTLDEGTQPTGLLIVSGGNEPRMGAHRGQALLAARIAARGYPVFRFDRRGVGDSEGLNGGWQASGPDIAAAAASFAQAAGVAQIIGFGNCDAASALAMFGQAAGLDGVLLSNPWLTEEPDALPPAAAIRRHYARKLANPAEWLRLARGAVDFGRLRQGLAKIAAPPAPLTKPPPRCSTPSPAGATPPRSSSRAVTRPASLSAPPRVAMALRWKRWRRTRTAMPMRWTPWSASSWRIWTPRQPASRVLDTTIRRNPKIRLNTL